MLDLSAISPDTVKHLPFIGVTLRPSLMDASTLEKHREALRMAIAGSGSPRANIADAKLRKFEDHHLTLRGERFKYHALPGGKCALYDLDADPGETRNVQSNFPEITARMGKDCLSRWDAIASSGRAFAEMAAGVKSKPEQ